MIQIRNLKKEFDSNRFKTIGYFDAAIDIEKMTDTQALGGRKELAQQLGEELLKQLNL